MNSRTLKNIDWVLVLLTVIITAYGILAIFSAGGGDRHAWSLVQKQLSSGLVGLALLGAAAALDDNTWPRFAGWIYWLNLGFLLLVDLVGHTAKGAQRWLMLGPIQLQPSEPAKVALIITLSVFFLRNYDSIRDLKTTVKSLIHIGIPMLLILKQPDLGTALVVCVIWLGVALAGGVRWKHILVLTMCAAMAFTVAWHVGLIRDYQKERLAAFLNPNLDPQGAGYHIRQAKIAIGSGLIFGKGYRKGTQSKLNFIPEQQTDFIFTIVGEELGFVGSAALVVMYWILVSRVATIMQSTEDRLGRMIAGGVLSMLLFHIFVNIGMTLGIMPVTGVPLPLFSYGRSNLISTMTALGLVLGVHMRRYRITF